MSDTEYESDHDNSLRERLRNAWVEIKGAIKRALCRHKRTHTSKQVNYSGKHYEVVEAHEVTSCSDCGKVMATQEVQP